MSAAHKSLPGDIYAPCLQAAAESSTIALEPAGSRTRRYEAAATPREQLTAVQVGPVGAAGAPIAIGECMGGNPLLLCFRELHEKSHLS